jgi:G3E family GTPase
LREDLLVEIKKLADEGRFDYIVIESTGISEPLQVAETFTFEDEDGGAPLSSWARLDTCVTVVDVVHFFDHVDSTKSVQDTGEQVGPEDLRTLSQLLIEQIEFSDVILLNKCDVADEGLIARVEHTVRSLNRQAELLRTIHSSVDLGKVINTGKFSMERAAEHAGWLKEIRGHHVPETLEYGISSFIYSRDRPFHPVRLYALTGRDVPLPDVVRSKGFVWIANHPNMQGVWASAGRMYCVDPVSEWEDDDEPSQTIVIIGVRLDVARVTELLDSCLATDAEIQEQDWQGDEDPYEEFSAQEEGEEEEDGEEQHQEMEAQTKHHKHE